MPDPTHIFNRHKGKSVNNEDVAKADLHKDTPESDSSTDKYFDRLLDAAKKRFQKNIIATNKEAELIRKNLKDAAIELEVNRTIYLLFGFLDGSNLAYSTFNYLLGMRNAHLNTNNDMHDWLLTDDGIASATLLSLALFTYSGLGSYFKDKDPNKIKAMIAKTWPFVRDILKASKNARKGIESIFNAFHFHEMRSNLSTIKPDLVFPIALALGILSMLNRVLYRMMLSKRKEMMDGNSSLLKAVLAEEYMNETLAMSYRDEIGQQDFDIRIAAIASTIYGGAIDSLYLYFGVFSLCAFSGPAFAMVLSCELIYSAINIGCRIWEEYDFQQQLIITGAQIKFELTRKLLEIALENIVIQIEKLQGIQDPSAQVKEQLATLYYERSLTIFDLRIAHKTYQKAITVSRLNAILGGLKNGLSAQNTVFGIMFTIATLMAVFAGTTCPPVFFITCTFIGLGFLSTFCLEAWIRNSDHRNDLQNAHLEFCAKLKQIAVTAFESKLPTLHETNLRPPVHDSCETIRTFASGLAKGIRFIQFAFNYLMIQGNGTYKDSKAMLIMMPFAMGIYSIIFALRAFARGFGRAPLFNPQQSKNNDNPKPTAISVGEFSSQDDIHTPSSPKRSGSIKRTPETQPTVMRPSINAHCYNPEFFKKPLGKEKPSSEVSATYDAESPDDESCSY